MAPTSTIVEEISLPTTPTITELQKRLRSSLENIVDAPDDEGPLVTFPDEGGSDLQLELRYIITLPFHSSRLINGNSMEKMFFHLQ